ncbi:MAG: cupredoxin domain-containing protein [Sphingomonadaceae bacterium]|nr:cupredoxin domain-containing protein [Sphingomonadaceae bacterium]
MNAEKVIKITAERYEYSPGKITLKRGEPVILELISEDRLHGFHVKGLNIRADVLPGQFVRVRVVPDKAGTYPFTCDLFCGSGHNDMSGVITVTD